MSKSKLYAAFGEIEIPCEYGEPITGWGPPLRRMRLKLDPLMATMALLKNDEKTIVMVSVDVVGLYTEDATALRKDIAKAAGTTFDSVMVSHTHNHCGPSFMDSSDTCKSEEVYATVRQRLIEKAAELSQKAEPAVWGTGFTYENDITFNRRYILRNGYAFAHPQIDKHDVLYAEGPIDPQVGVICVRNMQGEAMGYVVNFACHPLFYGGQSIGTANFPGVLRRELKRIENTSCVTVFVQGAAGDISHANPFDKQRTTMESVGQRLAERSYEVALKIPYSDEIELDSRAAEVTLLKRELTDEQVELARRQYNGEEVVIDPSWHPVSTKTKKQYAGELLRLKEEFDKNPEFNVPIQAFKIGETAWGTCPCELFVRLGMDIKLHSKAPITYVAAYTNGEIGYVAPRESYANGGYETTPCGGSEAGVDTGERLVKAVSELVNTLF